MNLLTRQRHSLRQTIAFVKSMQSSNSFIFAQKRLLSTSQILGPKSDPDPNQTNPLTEVIRQELQVSGKGSMSLARFMELGLSHPEFGYYSTKDKIFNKGGDFTTSPEISQMFGESLGIWVLQAMQNNYGGLGKPFQIVEIGPGSGVMMSDILRTVEQFGKLKNIDIALVESSSNLIKQQQERILELLQKKMGIYMAYDLQKQKTAEESESQVERFYNKENNFSITWYSDVRSLYNRELQGQVEKVESFKNELESQQKQKKGKKKRMSPAEQQKQIDQLLSKPMFVIAHELYDALPIHQFKYLGNEKWCEMVVKLKQAQDSQEQVVQPIITVEYQDGPKQMKETIASGELIFTESQPDPDNVKKVLQPRKFFSEEALKDLKPGDTFEVCPQATKFTQDITALVELTKGSALIVDYGENHAFSNSFRGIKDHKLIKDWPTIFKYVGNLDLTAYVNFQQIAEIAKKNKSITTNGPIPQGLFLESMGIKVRMEALQRSATTTAQRKLLEDSYVRLCSPDEMGAIYKFLHLGHKDKGDIFPFLGEETAKKEEIYG